MIQPNDKLPNATLFESTGYIDAAHCPTAPEQVQLETITQNKKVVIFGLPGAYTPTCSGKHVPGYLAAYDALRAKGVDEIICLSVNDGYVMAAWGRDQNVGSKIRMLGDANGELTRKLGTEVDLSASGMGLRTRRFSMLVENGIVKTFNLEQPGKFEVSNAETMLTQT